MPIIFAEDKKKYFYQTKRAKKSIKKKFNFSNT